MLSCDCYALLPRPIAQTHYPVPLPGTSETYLFTGQFSDMLQADLHLFDF